MRVFPVRVECPFEVPVDRPQHADPRMHQRSATLGRHDQRLGRSLPFGGVLLGLGQSDDVIGGVLQR
jgi:hypothetical protein